MPTDTSADSVSHLFVVIPAAGHSRRMGTPKLLLTLGDRPVILHLLDTLLSSLQMDRVVIVVRPSDCELRELLEAQNADRLTVIVPDEEPPEMRDSVEVALDALEAMESPRESDFWALIPADHPFLTRELWDEFVVALDHTNAEIVIPTVEGRGGHPTFFCWSLIDEIRSLPADAGLDRLVKSDPSRVLKIPSEAQELRFDLDTPADLERARKWWSERTSRD